LGNLVIELGLNPISAAEGGCAPQIHLVKFAFDFQLPNYQVTQLPNASDLT
jgi:hypothetical protein